MWGEWKRRILSLFLPSPLRGLSCPSTHCLPQVPTPPQPERLPISWTERKLGILLEGKKKGSEAQTPVTGPSPLGKGEPRVGETGDSSVAISQQLQHKGEDVDDICVDLQGTRDVVLWADGVLPVPQDQLCVISQELQGQGSQSEHPVNTQRPMSRAHFWSAELSWEPVCHAASMLRVMDRVMLEVETSSGSLPRKGDRHTGISSLPFQAF